MSATEAAAAAAPAAEAIIRRYYEAFNEGDTAGMIALLDDDVVHDINQGRREIGREAFAAFMAGMDRSYKERLADIIVMTEASGTRASAEFVVHGTYLVGDEGLPPANGQIYILPAGAFFELRGGRITRVTNYYNLENWLAQVAAAV